MAIIRVDEDFSLRMVMYKDYVRIDFRIYNLDNFQDYIAQSELPTHWDAGYKVLCDKDKLTENLQLPSYKAFIITKPSQEEFLSIVTNFFWDSTYVAKSLWRNELFFAKYMMDHVIRFSYLQKIIEWYVGVQNKWRITTNKYGRSFKQHLDSETWIELEKTFSGNETDDNWSALFTTLKLFNRLSLTIAGKLSYPYPQKLEIETTTYLKKVMNLDRNATDII